MEKLSRDLFGEREHLARTSRHPCRRGPASRLEAGKSDQRWSRSPITRIFALPKVDVTHP